MRMNRALGLLVALLFSAWTVAPVMGQSPASGGPPATPGKSAEVKGDKEKDRDRDKRVKADKEADDNERSNKGGTLRGLDRADQVAGEHGKQGRANARARQGR